MMVHQKVLSSTPENRETPLSDVQSWVTPNRWFFVRSHYETPEVELVNWRLTVNGCVQRPLELNWQQFEALPRRSVFSTVECAGNGRSFLRQHVEGVQWTAGAVGHAEWAGVPLRTVLEQAGLADDALEVVCSGADQGTEKGYDTPQPFARGLPVAKALHPDTLLATHMNGEQLEPSHGFPVRLLVPGWYGVASVKWVAAISVVREPFCGYFQTKKYTIDRQTGRGLTHEMVGPMPVKSEILRPVPGAELGVGANRIFGMAWAGEHAVAGVEVSVDGGRCWRRADLQGPQAPFSWTLWEWLWQVEAPGDYQILARAISSDGTVQPIDHDPHRGGYLINFSRPTEVTVLAERTSRDLPGDWSTLERDFANVARERSNLPLDADLELIGGAGI